MRHYLSLYFQFFRNCLMREMEFRFNFLLWSVIQLFWFALILVSVNLVFGQVSSIAGWTKNEVLVLAVVQTIFWDFLSIFARESLRHFGGWIRQGDFDYILLKPVNTRFLVSTRYFDLQSVLRFLTGGLILFLFLKNLMVQPNFWSWFNFLVLFLLGAAAFYSLFFALTTLNFWFINLYNLDEFQGELIDAGRYPTDIFKNKARTFFTYFVPAAFAATFPTLALFNKIDAAWIWSGSLVALVFFSLSHFFWRFGLKYYSSASS